MREYFLKTERIGFSKWTFDDLPLAMSLWSDKDVTKYISLNGMSEEDIVNRLKNEIYNYKNYGYEYFPIFSLSTGEHMGCCGFKPTKEQLNSVEMGCHLKSKFWGSGYAYECSKAAIDYAFNVLKVDNIYAGHHPDNIGSKNVLNKLGFEFVRYEHFNPTCSVHPLYIISKNKLSL